MTTVESPARVRLRLCLVAMPWAAFDAPSSAIGHLAAFVIQNEHRVIVECRHEFLNVWNRIQKYYDQISRLKSIGELLYAALIYPHRKDAIVGSVLEAFEQHYNFLRDEGNETKGNEITKDVLEDILSCIKAHLDETALSISQKFDVLGLTTSYAQLFPSLCVAKRVKEINPEVVVVLGGCVADRSGSALLNEFPFIDYIVKGEGELRLVRILSSLLEGSRIAVNESGILTNRGIPRELEENSISDISDIADLNCMPLPDYDSYASLADQYSVMWTIPLEGSRGCWWKHRVTKPGDKRLRGCCFCGLNANSRWRGKSAEQIGKDCDAISRKYQNIRLRFMDNVLPNGISRDLSNILVNLGKSWWFFVEVRATLKMDEFLLLRQAGCTAVQVGVEGLSNSYLRRINKGTTTILNLQAMRACCEFGIRNGGNILTEFPGATQEEVDEIRENILKFAIAYEPLSVSRFSLDVDSPIFMDQGRFGIMNVRPTRTVRNALSADLAERLQLPWLEHDIDGSKADWSKVVEACKTWRLLHQELKKNPILYDVSKPLFYLDGADFIEIVDRREGFRTIVLEPLWRKVYLYCTEIRSRTEIVEHFAEQAREDTLFGEIIESLVRERLMFVEGKYYLSLAVASSPEIAMRRMESMRNRAV